MSKGKYMRNPDALQECDRIIKRFIAITSGIFLLVVIGAILLDAQAPVGGTLPSGGINGSTATTIVLPVGGLTTGTCAAAAQVAVAGVTTTSVVWFDFASDPSAVVGYGSSGGLTLTAFGTAGQANIRQCNPTAGTITPGAMTVNVRVVF